MKKLWLAPVAGVILAGGLGRRMGGCCKALLDVGGHRVVDRIMDVYSQLFDEVVVAVREPDGFEGCGVPLALDRFEVRSSLTGIHAGLHAVATTHAFVAACDAPFLRASLVRALLAELEPGVDVVVPIKEDGYMEPLCAVYSKACLPHIVEQLGRGDCKIIRFFPKVRVKTIAVSRLREADPELASFLNMNTPADLELARELARQE